MPLCHYFPARPAFVLLCAFAAASSFAQPPFPPGVTLEGYDEHDSPPLPVGYQAEFLRVDWAHPLLHVEVIDHLRGQPVPPALNQVVTQNPDRLHVQLAAPLQLTEDLNQWRLALPFIASSDLAGPGGANETASRTTALQAPFLLVAGARSWLPVDPLSPDRPLPPISQREKVPALVGVRWVGTLDTLDLFPDLPIDTRVLLSLTSPASGVTRFCIAIPRSAGRTGELIDWLRLNAAEGDWITLHDMGPGYFAALDDWRLAAPGDPRHVERLGVTLELRALKPGEPVDWTRLNGSSTAASSHEREFPPSQAVSGLLLPSPFKPQMWISRPVEKREPIWYEVRFNTPRPATRVELFWGSAAGFSTQFNPRRVRLEMSGPRGLMADRQLSLEDLDGPLSVVEFEQPESVAGLRVILEEPSRLPLDARARLAALRLWGPWDGQTPAAPR